MRALLLAALLAAACAGCTSRVGPFVKSIRVLPDGRLEVLRCTVELSAGFFSYGEIQEVDCGRFVLASSEPEDTAPER